MDARTGQVLYEKNAGTPLHPASLTKMLTLYICFDAIRRGEISLDTMVTVSHNAAIEPPSHLGLHTGQKIRLRYLIRAAAVKSANDAATAIGEAISGSESAFARRMNATAKTLGMTRSHFLNANGLTREGHLSTAHDMAVLGRHLLYNFPQYYNLFSRRETYAGVAKVYNTNRRFLNAYRGADGIKTGYTSASGFNLVASAKRGEKRIIAAEFGGTSVAERNSRMTRLLDLGFSRAPAHASLRRPKAPNLDLIARADGAAPAPQAVRLATAVTISPRPRLRPETDTPARQLPKAPMVAMNTETSTAPSKSATASRAQTAATNNSDTQAAAPVAPASASPAPADEETDASAIQSVEPTSAEPVEPATQRDDSGGMLFASAAPVQTPKPETRPEIVTRLSTSGGRTWAINVGRFPSHFLAEKALMRTALTESTALRDTQREVVRRPTGFDANFIDLTQYQADLACARLQARGVQCFSLAPS